MHDGKHDIYEYYCTKCKIKITAGIGHVKCPQCKSGKHIVDYGDYGSYDNVTMGQGKFDWNKK